MDKLEVFEARIVVEQLISSIAWQTIGFLIQILYNGFNDYFSVSKSTHFCKVQSPKMALSCEASILPFPATSPTAH